MLELEAYAKYRRESALFDAEKRVQGVSGSNCTKAVDKSGFEGSRLMLSINAASAASRWRGHVQRVQPA
jgi:hypothetical protein